MDVGSKFQNMGVIHTTHPYPPLFIFKRKVGGGGLNQDNLTWSEDTFDSSKSQMKWSIFSTIIGHHAETNKQRKTHTKKTLKISIKPHSFTVLHHLTLILQYGMGERTKWLHGQDPTMFWKHVKAAKSSPHLLMAASHNSDPSFDTSSPSTSLTFSYARFTSWMALASAGSSRASGFTSSASCCCPVIGPVGVTWLMAGGWRTRTITARSCSCWRRNLSRLLWDAQRSVF